MSTARLIIASSENCSDLYWATRFYVPDPIIYLEFRGKKFLVASDLEYSRARKEAKVDQVLSYSDGVAKLRKAGKKEFQEGDVLDFLLRERRIRTLEVPSYFPIGQAELLRKKGFRVVPLPDPFFPERAIKTAEEKKAIVETIRATEAGINAAIEVLKWARIQKGKLYSNGSLLTSEALRRIIEMRMMERGARGEQTIVACGRQAADPHCHGYGPLLPHQSIVLDVFPKSAKTGYFGDVTRTVVKGHASEHLKKMYAAVRRAQENGIRTICHGVDAAKVHRVVAETLEKAGFKTGVKNGKPQGFIHSTGHGLGLDIHELPRVSRLPTILKKGNIITVEPGLYYEEIGGIRIEDDVYVTKAGCEVLTRLPKIFEIS